ncbi:MAG: hypothetical protein M1315_01425 [Candidatus Thermoplasmatota archaeon]|nr:hypothetical protein [Candidatus Thermoplasmatota archaeon]
MQSLKHPAIPDNLNLKLRALGMSSETIESLVSEYRKEHLRDPKTVGDILEVLE